MQTRTGRIRSGGAERDVTFDPDGEAPHQAIDEGYRTKYAGFDPSYVEPMTRAPRDRRHPPARPALIHDRP